MATTIAAYYTEELEDWNDTIDFYFVEIENLRVKLEDIIRRNSIKNIAEKVEIYMAALTRVTNLFYKIQDSIHNQGTLLKTGTSLIDNTLIKDEIEMQQAVLRLNMQGPKRNL